MKVAILGFGVVGRGTYEALKNCSAGTVEVKKILDVRVPEGMEGLVTTDYNEILGDPEIETVAEAIGGLHPAYEFLTAALKAGKHVASANKQLICHYYKELHTLAAACGRELRFTPSVGGGIPWLYNLRRTTRCDRIRSLSGIMNGTTNYILDAMQTRGIEFAEALAEAQRLGYAEADPTADIDGPDVRRKCAISASLAFGAVVTEDDVPTMGIRHITKADVRAFDAMGYVCKLMAYAEEKDGKITAYVEPCLLPKTSTEGAVRENFNCITLVGERVGRLSFIGQGAGKDPTGMALAEDLLDIRDGSGRTEVSLTPAAVDTEACAHPYYIRTRSVLSGCGILHRLSGAVVTVPLTPGKIRHIMKEVQTSDPTAFAAGLSAEACAAIGDR